jgi:hypothetical protein
LAARVALMLVVLMMLVGSAFAQAAEQGQAAPQPKPKAAPAADSAALTERVNALEKQNVVLSEDLGKARLDTRTKLEEAAKKQAEAIAALNQRLAEEKAKADAEKERQGKKNRQLWIAVGVLAIGLIAK